jgi:hypothetical protein
LSPPGVEMSGSLLERVRSYFKGYLDSLEMGRKKYGVWWVVFTGAMFFVVVVFIALALELYFFILPGLQ